MQSSSLTVVVLALVLALSRVREVNGAPVIHWDRCTNISVRLNQYAQNIAKEVLNGSRGVQYNISEPVLMVEPSDKCDPKGLRMNSKPCLQKIITALGNYSRVFQMEGLFLESRKEMARKVSVTVSELLAQLGADEPEYPDNRIHAAWMREDLAPYSVGRLLSFSTLVARVFAAGDPAAHDDAPPTCHQS